MLKFSLFFRIAVAVTMFGILVFIAGFFYMMLKAKTNFNIALKIASVIIFIGICMMILGLFF